MPASDPVQAGQSVRRTLEIEEYTNRTFVHPVAGRLVVQFARLGITPNVVSLCGMACGIGAGWAYYHYDSPGHVVAGFCLMILWHIMDGADGQLARLTSAQSETGKVLDGVCDYVTFIGVYLVLAVQLSERDGSSVWGLVILAGLCHAIQSAAYEKQREEYEAWGWGRPGSMPTASHPEDFGETAGLVHAFRQLFRGYARVQSLTAVPDRLSREAFAKELVLRPERADVLRRRYRDTFAPALRRWSVMSANYRTIGIFLFTICGLPIWYFPAEIIGLGAVLLVLLAAQRARYRRFCAGLDLAPRAAELVPDYRLAERNR